MPKITHTARSGKPRLHSLRQINGLLEASEIVGKEAQKSRQRGFINIELEVAEELIVRTAERLDKILSEYDEALYKAEILAGAATRALNGEASLRRAIAGRERREIGSQELQRAFKEFLHD